MNIRYLLSMTARKVRQFYAISLDMSAASCDNETRTRTSTVVNP